MWLSIGAISGFISVAAGAFGAHLLHNLPETQADAFDIGARYQLAHALALLAVAWLASRSRVRAVAVAGWSLVIGTVLFSGSLYAFALTGERWLAWVTPFGGAAFLVGWAALAWAGITQRKRATG